jgi:hypothetical protein
MDNLIIKTSEAGWFTTLATSYRNRTPVTLVDDAKIGIKPTDETLMQMGLKAKLSMQEWIAVGISVGVGAAGMTMIVLAFLDPEPTTKLGLLVGGGTVSLLGGGFSAIRILTKQRPPNIRVGKNGVELSWD